MTLVASIKLPDGALIFAESSQGAALSALFWWLIPLAALIGAVTYVIWVSRFKSKYENRIDRSVNRFRKFQDSFTDSSGDADSKDQRAGR
jgi:hypothetical protein